MNKWNLEALNYLASKSKVRINLLCLLAPWIVKYLIAKLFQKNSFQMGLCIYPYETLGWLMVFWVGKLILFIKCFGAPTLCKATRRTGIWDGSPTLPRLSPHRWWMEKHHFLGRYLFPRTRLNSGKLEYVFKWPWEFVW